MEAIVEEGTSHISDPTIATLVMALSFKEICKEVHHFLRHNQIPVFPIHQNKKKSRRTVAESIPIASAICFELARSIFQS